MIKKILFLLIFTISLSSIYILHWFKYSTSSNTEEIEYILPEGSNFTRVVYDLEKKHVLKYPKILALYAKIMNLDGNLKVGTYKFSIGSTPEQVLTKIIKGDIVTIKVTIPEGLNMYQLALLLSQNFPKNENSIWIELMESKELINFLNFNNNINNLEGFLFPETYIFDPNLPPKQVIKALISEFKKNLTADMLDKAKKLGLKPLEYITLASIVEKETAVSTERERVAGVYLNRLKIKMRLQADPTVIYGIWSKYTGSLKKNDLLTHTPYNTYTNFGLPPGPIASPGIASLVATLHPVSNDLYFVAKGDGSHVFSQNLAEHNKAVKKYVLYLKARKQKE